MVFSDVDSGLLDRLHSINITLTTQWNRLHNIRNTVDETGNQADRARARVRDAENLIDRARQELDKAKDAISKVVWTRILVLEHLLCLHLKTQKRLCRLCNLKCLKSINIF